MRTLLAVEDITHDVGIIRAGAWFTASDSFADQVLKSGKAVVQGTRAVWEKLPWLGSTIVCIASGPSLTKEDCELVRSWRAADPIDRRAIVVNTSYKLAPWADVLYAADREWWQSYAARVKHEFHGQLWSQIPVGDTNDAVTKFDLQHVRLERYAGLNPKVGFVNSGNNSGYQAIGLAYQAGAERIVLLGYDMSADAGRTHWHGEHGWWNAKVARDYGAWAREFKRLYADLCAVNVQLVNASRRTALQSVPQVSLEEALGL